MDAEDAVDSEVEANAVEVVAAPAGMQPPILLCCEHASNRLPPGWTWPEEDAKLADQHWGYDLGIADVTRRLAAAVGAPAVLGRFSRLLIDPNRPLDSDTLFRDVADGRPIRLNEGLNAPAPTPSALRERERRIEGFYRPYHAALDRMTAAHPGVHLLSLHSFTPEYEGTPRQVEVGVLFDEDEAWAAAWFEGLAAMGWDTRYNEPWSGRNGLMFSVQSHAMRYGRRAVELEFRQDHTTDPERVQAIVACLARIIRSLAAR